MRVALSKIGAVRAFTLTLLLTGLGACGNARRNELPVAPGDAGSGGADGDTSGAGAGGLPTPEAACLGEELAVPKRLIRLSFSQLAGSIGSLTDDAERDRIVTTYEIREPKDRTFPPLASPYEGSAYIDSTVSVVDKLAIDVASYSVDNVATFTPCGAEPSAACVQDFVVDFAERAYRRPLSADEEESLLAVLSAVEAVGDPPLEALRYGVQAALFSPQFLYRTEFGEDSSVAGRLAPHELADALAFFLTDAPPDDALLKAARNGDLSTPEQVGAHAARLLAQPRTEQNLSDAMFSYFGLGNIQTVKLDLPEFTGEVRASMYRESAAFLSRTLWTGPLTGLLTSRQTSVNASLAAIYGIEVFPPANAALDANGFTEVTLPPNRAGILTQAGYLTARSRPDAPSVVGRGMQVSFGLTCLQNPPFPEGIADAAISKNPVLANGTERQKAEYRASVALCNECHERFDAYGLALDTFDTIGRYRAVDGQGRPIDPAVTLPEYVGGQRVGSAAEMAQAVADSGRFESCMAQQYLHWALAEGSSSESLGSEGCAPRAIVDAFLQTDRTFADLLIEIAKSRTFGERAAGQAPP